MPSNQVNCWLTPDTTPGQTYVGPIVTTCREWKWQKKVQRLFHYVHTGRLFQVCSSQSLSGAHLCFFCGWLQRLDQVPSIKTICSQGENLLLTDKSLPSVGCNGSHLSFFWEHCPTEKATSKTNPAQWPLSGPLFLASLYGRCFEPPFVLQESGQLRWETWFLHSGEMLSLWSYGCSEWSDVEILSALTCRWVWKRPRTSGIWSECPTICFSKWTNVLSVYFFKWSPIWQIFAYLF